jgi:hypothetical protein
VQLTNLGVSPAPHSFGSVAVAGDYGNERVIAVLDRVDLDDYFQKDWPHLDDAQRRILVDGNKEIIGRIMQKKCEAGEWQDEKRLGRMVKNVRDARQAYAKMIVDPNYVAPQRWDAMIQWRSMRCCCLAVIVHVACAITLKAMYCNGSSPIFSMKRSLWRQSVTACSWRRVVSRSGRGARFSTVTARPL